MHDSIMEKKHTPTIAFVFIYKRCHKSSESYENVAGRVTCPSLESQH
jgi:hypothetical protein